MFGFLLVLLLLVGLFMTVVVLLQSGKGGGLAAMGGGGGGTAADNLIGGRQAATLLTKSTWISGGLFLFLSLTLSVLSSRQAGPESVLRGQFQQEAAPIVPQPVLPGAGAPANEGAIPGATPTGTGADGGDADDGAR
ncbi:MAG: preprotein translocase subunit SecG [Gemmatimonadota bacterium]